MLPDRRFEPRCTQPFRKFPCVGAFVLAIAIVSASAGGAAAQIAAAEEPLVGDRPDFTESALAVPPGRVQIEAGLTRALGEAADETEVGEVLVRVGVVANVEARLAPGSWAKVAPADGDDVDGFTDASVGFKIQLATPEGPRPGLALLAGTTLATGSYDFSGHEPEPEAILAAEWDLTGIIALGTNLGVARVGPDGGRFTTAWLSAALGIGLGGPWGLFVEGHGFTQEEDDGPSTGYLDTGVTWQGGANWQLDVRIGRGFRGLGEDWFLGAGAVLRI